MSLRIDPARVNFTLFCFLGGIIFGYHWRELSFSTKLTAELGLKEVYHWRQIVTYCFGSLGVFFSVTITGNFTTENSLKI